MPRLRRAACTSGSVFTSSPTRSDSSEVSMGSTPLISLHEMSLRFATSTSASNVCLPCLTMASASLRNGSPGFHPSTSCLGGSCRLTPAKRLTASRCPEAFTVSKTTVYSSAVSASSGCRKSAAAAKPVTRISRTAYEYFRWRIKDMWEPLLLIESGGGTECLDVVPVFFRDLRPQFHFCFLQIRFIPIRPVMVDGRLPLADVRHSRIQLLFHDAVDVYPVIGVLGGDGVIELLRNQPRLKTFVQ